MSFTVKLTVSQIRERLAQNPSEEFIQECEMDLRHVVQALLLQHKRREQEEEEERARIEKLLVEEHKLAAKGFLTVGGIDEAGRGPLAGPVVAAVCILPPTFRLPYLNDSKQLSAARREKLFEQITGEALDYAVGSADSEEIDRINILQATKLAMKRAIVGLKARPEYLLIDALELPDMTIPQKALIKGDCTSASIAAASILAKVTRDHWMDRMNELYPQYGFDRHKGYGTEAHLQALKEFGPCAIHRRSFAPVYESLA